MRRRRRTQQSFLIAEEPMGEELERALGQGSSMGDEVNPPGQGEPVDAATEPRPVEPTNPEPAVVEEWEPVLDPNEEAPQPTEEEPELPEAPASRPRRSREHLNRPSRPRGGRPARRPARLAAVAAVCFAGGLGLTLAARSFSEKPVPGHAVPMVAGPERPEVERSRPRREGSRRPSRRPHRRSARTENRRSTRRVESRQRARRPRSAGSPARATAVVASAPAPSAGTAAAPDYPPHRTAVPDADPGPRTQATVPAAPSSRGGQSSASGGGSSSSSASRRPAPSGGGEFSFER